MAAPAYKATGSANNQTTGNCSPPWPAGHAIGDVGILIAESGLATTHSLLTANGFSLVGTVIDPSNLTRLTIWWCRATSGAQATPVIAGNAAADHVHASIITFSGVIGTGNPWEDFQTSSNSTASTSVSAPGVTTALADALILAIITRDNDSASASFTNASWANASLTSVTERYDNGTASGLGGGIGAATGVKASPGVVNATTATTAVAVARSSATLALKAATSAAATITGVAGASDAGTLTANGTAAATTTGVAATSAAGTISAAGTAAAALSGVEAASAAGSLAAAGTSESDPLTGVEADFEAGLLSGQGSGTPTQQQDDSHLGIPRGGIFTVPPIQQTRQPLVSISAKARIAGAEMEMEAGRLVASVPIRFKIQGVEASMEAGEMEASGSASALLRSAEAISKAAPVQARGLKVITQVVVPTS